MASTSDILIVGGGVIGLTTAYFAATRSARVTLIDRGELGREASWAGAGIIPPGRPEFVASPYERLRAQSSADYPAFSDELQQLTGIDNGYRRCGGIEWLSEAEEQCFPALWQSERIAYQRMSGCELGERFEAIGEPTGTPYFLPDMAQVRNPRHLQALIAACRIRGVTLLPHQPVSSIVADQHRISGIVCDDGTVHQADQYLLAAGAWTDTLLAPLGVTLGVHPVRGQMVLYHPARPLLQPILLHGSRYLVPRDDGRILVGSTEEPEVGFRKANTPEGIDALKAFAATLVPELAQTPIEATWSGLRPGSRDGWPYLGAMPPWDNLYIGAGHFRAGLQLSVASGRGLCETMLRLIPTIPLEVFRPDRTPVHFQKAFRS